MNWVGDFFILRLTASLLGQKGVWGCSQQPSGIITKMDIHQLTQEMHRFVRSQGWYEADTKRPQTPRNLAISLCLEAAEVLEHFQWREDQVDTEELASELADVMLYLMQIASVSEINLEKAVLDKLAVNYNRKWDSGQSTEE
jgi:NTP pyrophosphatase (non-canonical NTP hydrolase)